MHGLAITALPRQRQIPEPGPVLRAQPGTRPADALQRFGRDTGRIDLGGRVGFVIALQDGQKRFGAEKLDALGRLGSVANDIAQTKKLADTLALDVRQHRLQRRQVGMNVTEDGDGLTHGVNL